MLGFDIETGPLPDDRLAKLLPKFVADDHVKTVGEFDALSVKTGNLKDTAKISQKIQDARATHEMRAKNYKDDVEKAELQHWFDFKSKAALSPITGQVLAIGSGYPGMRSTIEAIGDPAFGYIDKVKMSESLATESFLINRFWLRFLDNNSETITGFDIFRFDLPFLIRRSWMLGIEVPNSVKNGRYWNKCFVDLYEEWMFGQRGNAPILDNKLDTVCKAFGIQGKPDDGTTGADFARLLVEDRNKAIKYLEGDVRMVLELAEAMQVL